VLHAPTRPWGCWRARGQGPHAPVKRACRHRAGAPAFAAVSVHPHPSAPPPAASTDAALQLWTPPPRTRRVRRPHVMTSRPGTPASSPRPGCLRGAAPTILLRSTTATGDVPGSVPGLAGCHSERQGGGPHREPLRQLGKGPETETVDGAPGVLQVGRISRVPCSSDADWLVWAAAGVLARRRLLKRVECVRAIGGVKGAVCGVPWGAETALSCAGKSAPASLCARAPRPVPGPSLWVPEQCL